MSVIALKCPFCGSENISKNGRSKGKQRYLYKNPECSHTAFAAEYRTGEVIVF